MSITITMPDEMGVQLQRKAKRERLSVEEWVIKLLGRVLQTDDTFPSLEEVVAQIQATPPNPNSLRPASGSLTDALRDSPHDPDFDLDIWNQEWATVEAEMKAITRANSIAEGRA